MKTKRMDFISCIRFLHQRLFYIVFFGLSSHMRSFLRFRKTDSTMDFEDFVRASWVCSKWERFYWRRETEVSTESIYTRCKVTERTC